MVIEKKLKRNIIVTGSAILCAFTSIIAYQAYQEFSIYWDIPLTPQEINLYKNTAKAVVIYPFFTQVAYSNNGFYSYYKKMCGIQCLTVKFNSFDIFPTYNSGKTSYDKLLQLNYPIITDMYVDQHPDILSQYDKIIVLHAEYETKTVFHALTSHKNIIYLYPNTFYGLISTNYTNHTITLLKGHGYQINGSGFNWKYDNTHPAEFDLSCKNWKFNNIPNGTQLSCFPNFLILHDRNLLKFIRDYPN
jgi:hypothetical protein